MKKRLKSIGMLLLILSLCLAGCQTQTLDGSGGQTEKQTQIPAATQQASSTNPSSEPMTEESSETEADDVMRVEDVSEDSREDLSRYEEQQITETVVESGAGSGLVTYSDGKEASDGYNTDPIPEGKPNPVEPEDVKVNEDSSGTCTLWIECSALLNHLDELPKGKEKVVPDSGEIYAKKEVTFYEGESVFDVLLRETKKARIQMEYAFTPVYNSNYIEGINNLYEFDGGELSGWTYSVNGWFPNYGSSRYLVKQSDQIVWHYTCDLGRDVGGQMNE